MNISSVKKWNTFYSLDKNFSLKEYYLQLNLLEWLQSNFS
jgi:hypothetical protein